MVLMTMIARVADGLPLAASVQEDEQVGFNYFFFFFLVLFMYFVDLFFLFLRTLY